MNRQNSEKNLDLRVSKVLHISCNTGTFALYDMSALAHALRCCPNISGNVLAPVLYLLHDICDLILENQPSCHIWYIEKYQF